VVLALDVLEHMERWEAMAVIRKAEMWARKRVIIWTPKQLHSQETQGNPYNQHKCLIPIETLEGMGYSEKKTNPDFNVLVIKELS